MSAQGQSWQKDAADQNFDYMFKLLIIGNSSVGKTRDGSGYFEHLSLVENSFGT